MDAVATLAKAKQKCYHCCNIRKQAVMQGCIFSKVGSLLGVLQIQRLPKQRA